MYRPRIGEFYIKVHNIGNRQLLGIITITNNDFLMQMRFDEQVNIDHSIYIYTVTVAVSCSKKHKIKQSEPLLNLSKIQP